MQMSDVTYAITHVVGTSPDGIDQAIRNGVKKAGETLRNLDWFEVSEIRGYLDHSAEVQHFQVTMKIGFRYGDCRCPPAGSTRTTTSSPTTSPCTGVAAAQRSFVAGRQALATPVAATSRWHTDPGWGRES